MKNSLWRETFFGLRIICLSGFPDCCLKSFSGYGFRENRDGVGSGTADGHDDDPRRSGESQFLCQVTVFLKGCGMVIFRRALPAGFDAAARISSAVSLPSLWPVA
jgi:hypothetical protein